MGTEHYDWFGKGIACDACGPPWPCKEVEMESSYYRKDPGEDIYWADFREHFRYDPPPMIEGHTYLCYQKEQGGVWQMQELRYSEITNMGGVRQPMYVVTNELQYPGPAGALIPVIDVT